MSITIVAFTELKGFLMGIRRIKLICGVAMQFCILASILCAFIGCSIGNGDVQAVKSIIMRYNRLVAEGYRKQNMNPLQEVASKDHALKLYYHMSALGEGKLRMDSTLKDLSFTRLEFPRSGEAIVETKEIWDFTQTDTTTGRKYYEEKDYIYVMGYRLKKNGASWLITSVNTIAGTSVNTTIPRPRVERKVNIALPSGHPK